MIYNVSYIHTYTSVILKKHLHSYKLWNTVVSQFLHYILICVNVFVSTEKYKDVMLSNWLHNIHIFRCRIVCTHLIQSDYMILADMTFGQFEEQRDQFRGHFQSSVHSNEWFDTQESQSILQAIQLIAATYSK